VIIAPDGSLFYGAYTRYNYFQGHLMKFSSTGQYLGSYPFGWDTTPSIYSHDGTYSLIFKDNHYSDGGSYCNDPVLCPEDRTASNPASPEEYFITRLDKNLNVEWKWQNTNQLSCTRAANGQVTCNSDHPNGFEWCVNAAVVDATGTTYANSEDGNIYVINPNGTLRENLFLNLAIGAAYTPLSMSSDGKIFTQNDGVLFVVGN
jgi:outer membrane protein assembly factor BamB